MFGVANRITGGGIPQPDSGRDAAAVNFWDFHPIVGVHLVQTPDPFLFSRNSVINYRPGLDPPGIYPEIYQAADERVGDYLEG
ncbi:MAG: hypothetical protein DDT26_01293 [Dehalococcoidia bacterium]|nr:hypothetical protein [Chloroflexota bacterium]